MQVVQYSYQKTLAEFVRYSIINKMQIFVSNNMINNQIKMTETLNKLELDQLAYK